MDGLMALPTCTSARGEEHLNRSAVAMERSLCALDSNSKSNKRRLRHEYQNDRARSKKPLVLSPYFCEEASTPVKPLLLSPYFRRPPPLHTVESVDVHVLPHNNGTNRPLREKPNTTLQHFHFQTPDERDRKGKRKREKKKEAVVVSPYFQNRNNEGGEASTSPSLSTSGGEREGGRERKGSTSNFNKFLEAYRRKRGDSIWIPPKSVHGLLQEKYYEDPWKVLIICMLLNRTRGCQAANVIANLFEWCPNAKAAVNAETEKIENIITTLGLQKKRSVMIQQFSEDYLSDKWTHVTQLHGIGKYAADAYAIFCTGHWKDVNPDDHKLVPYWEDLWITEND